MLRSSNLDFSCSSSEPESCSALYLTRLFCFRISFTALVTRAFRSLPLIGRFLAPWNFMRPSPPQRAVYQVNFMALACSRMTFHYFILWPDPCRGRTGEFSFLVFFLLVSSSDRFAAWYDPLICAYLAYWWRSPDCLVFLFWWFPSPCVWNISSAVLMRSQNLTSSVSHWV